MRRWIFFLVFLAGLLFFLQKPKFWSVFSADQTNYLTDTFYYIIKEEYEQDEIGQRLYRQKFTNLQNGDILVTDSTYCFCFRHGHAALVVDAAQGITLEAFGVGTKSKYSSVADWKRYPHVLVLRLKESREVRETIAEYAKQNLMELPYRISTGMIDDKDMNGDYWGTQCAHLVWAAYFSQGYDIDGNGGWLVAPEDFVKSELLWIVPQS